MTIELNQKDAYSKLSKISIIINHSVVLPILESTYVQVFPSYALFYVTDLETLAEVKIAVATNKTGMDKIGEFVINFKSLLHFLKTADPLNVVQINIKGDDAILSSGEFKAKITLDKIADYPKPPSFVPSDTESIQIEYREIIEHFRNCLRFVSADDLRPAMTGVYIHSTSSKNMIVATDAHKLYYAPFKIINKNLLHLSAIIPTKPLRVISALPSFATFFIMQDTNYIEFRCGDFTITSRKIDARYPDYSVILPNYEAGYYLKRKQLKIYLNMAIAFTNKVTGTMNFLVEDNALKMIGGDVDFSIGCYCSIPIYNQYNMRNHHASFNIKFLMQAIECSKDENIHIKTSLQHYKAIDVDEKIIIMPLMNQNEDIIPDWVNEKQPQLA